jgi:hypothetical protein
MTSMATKLRARLAFLAMEVVSPAPFLVSASRFPANIHRRFGCRFSGAGVEMLRQAASIISLGTATVVAADFGPSTSNPAYCLSSTLQGIVVSSRQCAR